MCHLYRLRIKTHVLTSYHALRYRLLYRATNFMQFLGKFGKIVCWRPPGELVPPPRGNPGSATVMCSFGQNIGLLLLVLIASQTQAPIVKVACKTATNLSPYLR